jgi:hypothetical protein
MTLFSSAILSGFSLLIDERFLLLPVAYPLCCFFLFLGLFCCKDSEELEDAVEESSLSESEEKELLSLRERVLRSPCVDFVNLLKKVAPRHLKLVKLHKFYDVN